MQSFERTVEASLKTVEFRMGIQHKDLEKLMVLLEEQIRKFQMALSQRKISMEALIEKSNGTVVTEQMIKERLGLLRGMTSGDFYKIFLLSEVPTIKSILDREATRRLLDAKR